MGFSMKVFPFVFMKNFPEESSIAPNIFWRLYCPLDSTFDWVFTGAQV